MSDWKPPSDAVETWSPPADAAEVKKNSDSESISEPPASGSEITSVSPSESISSASNSVSPSADQDSITRAQQQIERRRQLIETGQSDIPKEKTTAEKLREATVTTSDDAQAKVFPAGHFTDKNYNVDGELITRSEMMDRLYSPDFIEKLQKGTVKIDLPEDPEIHSLIERQAKAGTRLGDIWESALSGTYNVAAGVVGAKNYLDNIISEATGLPVNKTISSLQSKVAALALKKQSEEERAKIRQYQDDFIGTMEG